MDQDIELIDGGVMVALEAIGEGLCGEYNPDDPDDVELLRFTVYRDTPDGWDFVDDASYCTQIPVDTPEVRCLALGTIIMDRIGDDVRAGNSVKKACEELSWISPDWA